MTALKDLFGVPLEDVERVLVGGVWLTGPVTAVGDTGHLDVHDGLFGDVRVSVTKITAASRGFNQEEAA